MSLRGCKKLNDSRLLRPHQSTISSLEAAYQIFSFPLHGKVPSVIRLPVHLPSQQLVQFDPNAVSQDDATPSSTMLMAFFDYNNHLTVEEEPATYADFVEGHTYIEETKQWLKRKRNESRPLIGRMYGVSPSQGEQFYLRLLLAYVKGPKSFEDLRRVQGNLHATFQQACTAYGIVGNDEE